MTITGSRARKSETITAAEGFFIVGELYRHVQGGVLTEPRFSRFTIQVKVSNDYDFAHP